MAFAPDEDPEAIELETDVHEALAMFAAIRGAVELAEGDIDAESLAYWVGDIDVERFRNLPPDACRMDVLLALFRGFDQHLRTAGLIPLPE